MNSASAGQSEANSRRLYPLPGNSAVGGNGREPIHVNANSSGLCPQLGVNAVGGDTRDPVRIRCATCRGPYAGPLKLALWNCRSLWAQGTTETIYFVMQLTHAHSVTVLTETRESKERLVFLKSKLPGDLQYFSSRLDQFKGGVAIIVQNSCLQAFSG